MWIPTACHHAICPQLNGMSMLSSVNRGKWKCISRPFLFVLCSGCTAIHKHSLWPGHFSRRPLQRMLTSGWMLASAHTQFSWAGLFITVTGQQGNWSWCMSFYLLSPPLIPTLHIWEVALLTWCQCACFINQLCLQFVLGFTVLCNAVDFSKYIPCQVFAYRKVLELPKSPISTYSYTWNQPLAIIIFFCYHL